MEIKIWVTLLLSFGIITGQARRLFYPKSCQSFEFQCDVSKCISARQVCDGSVDCIDNTDEHGCDTSNSHIFSKELYVFEASQSDSTDVYNLVEETTMSEQ